MLGDGYAVRTQKEVAEIMTARGDKLSRVRVQQIEKRALAKLRKALAEYEPNRDERA